MHYARGATSKGALGWLRKGDEFCCLGVLCDVAGAKWTSYETAEPDVFECNEGAVLLANDGAKFGLTRGQHKVMFAMNDSGESFAEIADWIEANL